MHNTISIYNYTHEEIFKFYLLFHIYYFSPAHITLEIFSVRFLFTFTTFIYARRSFVQRRWIMYIVPNFLHRILLQYPRKRNILSSNHLHCIISAFWHDESPSFFHLPVRIYSVYHNNTDNVCLLHRQQSTRSITYLRRCFM